MRLPCGNNCVGLTATGYVIARKKTLRGRVLAAGAIAVSSKITRGVRLASLFVLLVAVGSCGLPRAGPNKREIFASSVQRQGDAFIVTINERVIQKAWFTIVA